MEPVKDILFPSDNIYDIPCLRLDRQAGHLELPFVPYGTGRRNKRVATLHFYVDDYRFNALWKNPAKIFDNNPASAVECNYSLFDTTAVACLNTGRNFIGFELDENYSNLASERVASAQRQLLTLNSQL